MNENALAGKPHYEILDGLRGIAALSVVVFHCYEILTPELTHNPIAHGFLAVDFFFCLSGFVIGYAYDNRIHHMGVKQFLLNRLIRLQPLVFLGTALGLLGLFLDPFTPSPVQNFGWAKIIVATFCSILMLPCPILGRYENVFPLNAPAWSLSMEYFINLVYAFVLVHITKKILIIFLTISFIIIIGVGWLRGNLLGGWNDITFADGYARVFFSFLAGLTIYRFRLILNNKIHFIIYAIVLAAIFLFPHFENDWIIELLFVIVLFPIIICSGAGTHVSTWVRKVCTFLGDISYPLYMTHYWMIWILGNYAATQPGEKNLYIFAGGVLVSAILLAVVVMKYYDNPIRNWLIMRYNGALKGRKV